MPVFLCDNKQSVRSSANGARPIRSKIRHLRMRHVKTQVEALEGDKVKAVVTVDEKAVDAKISQTYKDFARKYNFPGFRKGKAPRPVIDNALGAEAVLAVVTDELVNSAYPQVVEAERLFPVGQPQLEDDGALVESGKPFTFTFEVDVRPTYELSSYEPVEVELPIAGATEEEIDAQIEALQQHYATFEDASAATKMKAENQADLAMEATDEKGAPIEFICTESRLYEPGTPLFSKAFDDEILGMKKGDSSQTLPDKKELLYAAALAAVFFLYILVVKPLGYILSTILVFPVFMFIYGERRWLRMGVISVVFSVVTFYLFERVFYVFLPHGSVF